MHLKMFSFKKSIQSKISDALKFFQKIKVIGI